MIEVVREKNEKSGQWLEFSKGNYWLLNCNQLQVLAINNHNYLCEYYFYQTVIIKCIIITNYFFLANSKKVDIVYISCIRTYLNFSAMVSDNQKHKKKSLWNDICHKNVQKNKKLQFQLKKFSITSPYVSSCNLFSQKIHFETVHFRKAD